MWIKAQEGSAIREAEAFKYKLYKAIDEINKIYTDIVVYEKKYSVTEGKKALESKINTYVEGLATQLADIANDVKTYATTAIENFEGNVGKATTPIPESTPPETPAA